MVLLHWWKSRPLSALIFITLLSLNQALLLSQATTQQLKIASPPLVSTQSISVAAMTVRRSKTERRLVSENFNNISKNEIRKDPLSLATLYRGVSMMHFGQIMLAVKKSGVTLGSLNVIGGPLMASGITFILGKAAEKHNLRYDTSKRLNGLLFLYATLALILVALAPQLYNPFGMLWFLSGSSTLFVATKGYFSGLKANDNENFLTETSRLLKAALKTPMARPTKKISFGDFASLWTILAKKTMLGWGILKVLLTSGLATRSPIVLAVSQLTKLTILGGSIVTALSIGDDPTREDALVPLNFLASYTLTTMAGKDSCDDLLDDSVVIHLPFLVF